MPMFHRLGNEFVDDIKSEFKREGYVKLIALCERSMLNAICEVGLGMVGDSNANRALKIEFGETFEYLRKAQMKRQTRLSVLNTLPSAENHKFNRMLRKLDEILDVIISNPMNDSRTDILALMMKAQEPSTGRKFSVTEIKHQLITLLVAGHKTSSLLLAWSIFCISQDASIEQKVRKELKEQLKLDGKNLKFPTFEELKKLTYVDMILKETMRLHPPAQSAVRGLGNNLKVGNYMLKPGNVFISIYDTHRNEEYWKDPERFDPERFTPENLAKQHKGQYIPFGGFDRTCLGNLFAITEVKVNLCLIYQLFHPRASALHPIQPANNPLFPLSDLPMTFVERSHLLGSETNKEEREKVDFVQAKFEPKKEKTIAKTKMLVELFQKSEYELFILYGSNTGTSKEFALQLARKAEELTLKPVVMSLDDYHDKYLVIPATQQQYHTALIFTSTWNGNPPDNAKKFKQWISNCSEKGSTSAASKLNFAVFGVGNSHWNMTYLAFPKFVENQLVALGGNNLIKFRSGDESKDLQDKFEALQDTLWYFFAYELKLLPNVDPNVLLKPANSNLEVEFVDEPVERRETKTEEYFTLLQVKELQSNSERSTKHIQMRLPDGISYETGDHLEVSAENPPGLVEKLCEILKVNPNHWVKVNQSSSFQAPGWVSDEAVTISSILSRHLDINGIVTRQVLQILSNSAADPTEKSKLESYSGKTQESFDTYQREIIAKGINVVELLTLFPSVEINMSGLFGILPTLKKRSYSISSSPLKDPQQLSLSVGQVSFLTPTGRKHSGTASTFLGRGEEGAQLKCNINKSPMRHPKTTSTPLICVCNGTGLAPFRGFLQEREELVKSQGNSEARGEFHLFFGCRSSKEDFIYSEELLDYERKGLVNLHVAFSRDHKEKLYVQDLMKQESELIASLILEQNANFYVCGDAKTMAKDVQSELCKILESALSVSQEDAKSRFLEMVNDGRIVLDVWGGNHN